MQIYSRSGFKFGGKSKSNMAEFSLNPDGRKKAEVSYQEHMNRSREEDNNHTKFRIRINKARYEKGLATFKDQDIFDEVIEECEFENKQLENFLMTYDLKLSIDENIGSYVPIAIDNITMQIMDINDFPALEVKNFLDSLNMKYSEFNNANNAINKIEGINNVYNVELISVSNTEYISYQRILIFIWMYYKKYSDERQKKLIEVINSLDKRIEMFSLYKRQNNTVSSKRSLDDNEIFKKWNKMLDEMRKSGIDRNKPYYKAGLNQIMELKKLCTIEIEKSSK